MTRLLLCVVVAASCAKKQDAPEPQDKPVPERKETVIEKVTRPPADHPNAPSGYQCGDGGKAVPKADCLCPEGSKPARDDENVAICVSVRLSAVGSGAPTIAPTAPSGVVAKLIKVSGEGQVIPPNEWRNFVVKAVDGTGKPVAGARIAWQTPTLGSKTYIGTTGADGTTSATQLYSGSGPAELTETAGLVVDWKSGQWSETAVATTLGVTFKFSQRAVTAAAPTPTTLKLIKVSGEGQVIPPNDWRNFVVKVVDGSGKPVAGVKVAWRTPALGPKTYIGTTGADGTSSATQLYSGPGPADLTEVAGLAPDWKGGQWSEDPVATTTSVTFTFSQK